MVVSAVLGVQPSYAASLTAGDILKEMPANEFVVYVAGMVEGFAYARFRKDSIEAGRTVETGMRCIRDFYLTNPKIILMIEDAFRLHAQHAPSVVLAAMLKKECGE
ncbi:hypothetical protein [Mesorhizobium sp. J428]|uniref:hypothetical protein n=1 Tax=Mesorhizobium sp. J428 TaxID=2898440 RepID=UPI002151440D|nr:hypothetical protein [Mesorhizobium sp. J428]MCR5858278.1 hypothetical protein [Mesorhizobium sp. J428]